MHESDTPALFAEFCVNRTEALRNQLVEAHMGLAGSLAHRFAHRGEPYDDLFQVASLALVRCVDRFDPARNVSFSTFATRTITGELKRYFRDRCWSVRAPRRLQELFLEIGPTSERLAQRIGHPPTTADVARELHQSEGAINEALGAGSNYRASSIDRPDGDGVTVGSQLGSLDRAFTTTEERITIDESLIGLPEREQRILKLRYLDGCTQAEIASRIGVSQMHVSRLLAHSLATLRETVRQAS